MEGVRSRDCVIRLSAKLLAILDSHSATASSTPNLINSNGVNRSPPSTIETESNASIVGLSWPMMVKAATSHADSDTRRTINGLRMTDVTRRMISQARASFAATASKSLQLGQVDI